MIPLVWGPLRHIVGLNIADCHCNGDNTRAEIFCEMDQMKDDEPDCWNPRSVARGNAAASQTRAEIHLRSQWGFGSNGQGFEQHI